MKNQTDNNGNQPSRRQLLQGGAGLAALTVLDGCGGTAAPQPATAAQPVAAAPAAGGGDAPAAAPASAGSGPDAMAKPGAPSLGRPPAEYLDLTNFKLTLPFGQTHKPTEIKQPALKTYQKEGLFYLTEQGVLFRCHCGGVTTPNSSYPRTELREMRNNGMERAAWSSTSGRHTMSMTAAITNTPVAKAHVVAGQLHDAKDDVCMVRLEREHLFIEAGGNNIGTLEATYKLGTFFSVILDCSDGRVRVYYNGEQSPRVDVERKVEGCYFKAGAYTQSNPSKGDAEDAYGEVIISQLSVQHT